MKIRNQSFTAIIILLLLIAASCGQQMEEEPTVYTAELNNLNQNITDQPASGELTVTVKGDSATIKLNVSSVAPDIMHLAHLHGYEDGSEAKCPTFPEADNNNDSIVDLIETRDYSGITMIPFHDDPVSLEIKTDTYPKADAQGNFNYSKVVSMQALSSAVSEKFGIENFSFDNFVVFVHGIRQDTTLPESVQSLPDVPAKVTLPVGCGELEISAASGSQQQQ